MSCVAAPNAVLARRTAAARAGSRASVRARSVVRCEASSRRAESTTGSPIELGRRDVFGALAAGAALLASRPALALEPGDVGYLKAQREAKANAPPAATPPPPKEGTKSSKDLTGVNTGILAGVVATGLLLSTTSDEGFNADTASKPKPAPASKPSAPAAGASDAAANAADAQRWIDDWSRGGGAAGFEDKAKEAQGWIDAWKKSGGGADTPEGRAKEAQAWIDAWKK